MPSHLSGDIGMDAMSALEAGIAEADRRESGEFDGLLGQIPNGASVVLSDILSFLRDYLLDRYSENQVRNLLQEFEPVVGYRNVSVVPDDVELALCLLNSIRGAMRCDDNDSKHPDHFTRLIFGSVGVRDKRRQAGTRKERKPDLMKWILGQLQRDPTLKSPDLWARTPTWITDQISQARFAKRVTLCRKRVASK